MRIFGVWFVALVSCCACIRDDTKTVDNGMCATMDPISKQLDGVFPYHTDGSLDMTVRPSYSVPPLSFQQSSNQLKEYFNATGTLRVFVGGVQSHCSAFAVGKTTIMTAMHCTEPGASYQFTSHVDGHDWQVVPLVTAVIDATWVQSHTDLLRDTENDHNPSKPNRKVIRPLDIAVFSVHNLTFTKFFSLVAITQTHDEDGDSVFVDSTGNEIEHTGAVICSNSFPTAERDNACNRPGYPSTHNLGEVIPWKKKSAAPAELLDCSSRVCSVRWTAFRGCSGGPFISLEKEWVVYGVATTEHSPESEFENYNFITTFAHPNFQQLWDEL
eukprot:TRINITY_DN51822_c0_g1_i2.p1 TRINITY_DN51822_c0_g1~~TRINITY_DN51822_c0_g1_i2.p1  ORF type:complete len:336 (+),score=16.37 TRINITY_DN51822_c0_g1_i2:27-1010(+)